MDYDTDVDDSPLELGFTPKSQVSIDPEMVRAIAMGLEDPAEVAARYGFTGAKWERLQKWQPFLASVAAQKADLEKSGVTFRNKAALMADQLADQVFVEAMSTQTGLSQKVAVMQYFAKMAELEPNPKVAPQQGPGFSIQINLSGRSVTLNGQAPSAPPTTVPADVIDVPETPKKIKPPAFAPLVDPEFLRELQENGE